MSLFDPPNTNNLSEDYPKGTPMMMYDASWEGVRDTAFGMSAQASVRVGPPDRSGGSDAIKSYRVFGNLAEAVQNLSPSDLPALVKVITVGRRYQWEPVAGSVTASGRMDSGPLGDEDIPY